VLDSVCAFIQQEVNPSKVFSNDATNMCSWFIGKTEHLRRSYYEFQDMPSSPSFQEICKKLCKPLVGLDSYLFVHETNNSGNVIRRAICCEIEQIFSCIVKAKKEADQMNKYKVKEYDFYHSITSNIHYELIVYSDYNRQQDDLGTADTSVAPHPNTLFRELQKELQPAIESFDREYFPSPQDSISPHCFSPRKSGSFSPRSWDAEILQHSSDLTALNKFIQSLPPELRIQQDAQNRTICHALGSLSGHLSFAELEFLPELISRVCPRECMVCQDSFGNTPLHCIVEALNSNIDGILESILKHAPAVAEGLGIRNRDNLTPLDLAFEKKLWVPARVLAEHQIETGTNCAFLQDYFFKAMREQGGVDFLPHLLDICECYCPSHDHGLNFDTDTTGRTPWWYLVNSNDVSVMCRTLQALKDHSVDLTSLQTHTETGTTLVEEAVEKNRVLFMAFRKVAGWDHNDTDQDTADQDISDQDVNSDSGRALSPGSSCSSITDSTYIAWSESENNIQLGPDRSSVSSTSDEESDSET